MKLAPSSGIFFSNLVPLLLATYISNMTEIISTNTIYGNNSTLVSPSEEIFIVFFTNLYLEKAPNWTTNKNFF